MKSILLAASLLTLFAIASTTIAKDSLDVELLKSGDFSKAKRYLEAALQQQPSSASLHCNLGIALLRTRNYQDALDHLHKAVGLQPQLSAAWLNLAGCYLCLGEFDRSIDAYQRVQMLQPTAGSGIEQLIGFLRSAKTIDETAPDYLNASWRRWKDGDTIKLFIDTPKSLPNYRKSFNDLAARAMQQAVTACGGKLKLELAPTRAQANVTCDWVVPKGAMSVERGVTTAQARGGKIFSGAVQIFLNNESGLDCLTEETINKSLLHEFCHVLGIAGHSTNVEDVMFAIVETPTVEPRLSPRDRETLRKLYSDVR